MVDVVSKAALLRAAENQRKRWYKLPTVHPVQQALLRAVDDGIRFIVVPAGRRSGKSELAKRFGANYALKNPGEKIFFAAPTMGQSVKIFWKDLKNLTISSLHPKKPSETNYQIFLPNGSEIHVIGLDEARRFEGIDWSGGIVDEIADVKEVGLKENIMPALDTVNPLRPYYRAWCWFIGVPDGLNHFYEMAQYAETANDPLWKLFHWKTEEILPPDVIEAARRRMSPKQFKQEYCASFETASGKIYEDYSKLNWTSEKILPHEELHWSHDQNYTPLSSCISVVRDNKPYFLDEIVLESAISRQSAFEFVEKFKKHSNKKVYIYGDPAGRAGEKHGHRSDYTDIEDVLRRHGWSFERRVKPAHPAIKDRQNAVRALIKNAVGDVNLFVNPSTAVWSHRGLSTVQLQGGSSFQEDQRNKYQHITTAIGYFVDYLWPVGKEKSDFKQTFGLA